MILVVPNVQPVSWFILPLFYSILSLPLLSLPSSPLIFPLSSHLLYHVLSPLLFPSLPPFLSSASLPLLCHLLSSILFSSITSSPLLSPLLYPLLFSSLSTPLLYLLLHSFLSPPLFSSFCPSHITYLSPAISMRAPLVSVVRLTVLNKMSPLTLLLEGLALVPVTHNLDCNNIFSSTPYVICYCQNSWLQNTTSWHQTRAFSWSLSPSMVMFKKYIQNNNNISLSCFMICSKPQHVMAITLKNDVFVTVSKPKEKQRGEKVNNGIIRYLKTQQLSCSHIPTQSQ